MTIPSEVRCAASTTFGRLLRHWRAVRRIPQLDLAHLARVSPRHLSFLETGRSRPDKTWCCASPSRSTCRCATASLP